MTTDERLDALLDLLKVRFAELNGRVDTLAMEAAQSNAGVKMALAGLDAVNDSLGEHLAEMQRFQQTVTRLSDGMLALSADLQLTRQSVAQQVTHEVEKKLDAHLSVVELSEVAREAAGGERQR